MTKAELCVWINSLNVFSVKWNTSVSSSLHGTSTGFSGLACLAAAGSESSELQWEVNNNGEKLQVGRNGSALDPIGLSPWVPLWSLHNVVFFIASKLHLDEILLSKRSSKCTSLQFLRKKKVSKSVSGYRTRSVESAVHHLTTRPLKIGWLEVIWLILNLYSNNPYPK